MTKVDKIRPKIENVPVPEKKSETPEEKPTPKPEPKKVLEIETDPDSDTDSIPEDKIAPSHNPIEIRNKVTTE